MSLSDKNEAIYCKQFNILQSHNLSRNITTYTINGS
jgi:hypothetical protein